MGFFDEFINKNAAPILNPQAPQGVTPETSSLVSEVPTQENAVLIPTQDPLIITDTPATIATINSDIIVSEPKTISSTDVMKTILELQSQGSTNREPLNTSETISNPVEMEQNTPQPSIIIESETPMDTTEIASITPKPTSTEEADNIGLSGLITPVEETITSFTMPLIAEAKTDSDFLTSLSDLSTHEQEKTVQPEIASQMDIMKPMEKSNSDISQFIATDTQQIHNSEQNIDTIDSISQDTNSFFHPEAFIKKSIADIDMMIENITGLHDEKVNEAKGYGSEKERYAEKEKNAYTEADDMEQNKSHAVHMKQLLEKELKKIESPIAEVTPKSSGRVQSGLTEIAVGTTVNRTLSKKQKQAA